MLFNIHYKDLRKEGEARKNNVNKGKQHHVVTIMRKMKIMGVHKT